jgi:hypothetical protein
VREAPVVGVFLHIHPTRSLQKTTTARIRAVLILCRLYGTDQFWSQQQLLAFVSVLSICLWTFRCLSLFWLLPPVTVLSDLGHLGVLPSLLLLQKITVFHRPSWHHAWWALGTGIFFGYHYHRCQDFCSLHGFRLTLEANQGAQLRLGAQNLASSGAGMVASGSGLTSHVIP